MPKDFDLTSQKWLDLVFQDKNRTYGAYELRSDSSSRHLKALIIVTLVGLALIYLPAIIKSAIPEKEVKVLETTEVKMVDINLKQEVPEENIIRALDAVPNPPLKTTIQFTTPTVVADDLVRDEDLMLTQDELTESTAQISVATVQGVDDGIDIVDLQNHAIIVQDVVEQDIIHDYVEEPPMFPGGDGELMKWLQQNIQYPVIAQEQNIQGRVTLRFVVKPDGSVGEVQILRPLHPSLDKEAIRVVGRMPKWKPGRQNGNAVSVWFNLPVSFKLEQR